MFELPWAKKFFVQNYKILICVEIVSIELLIEIASHSQPVFYRGGGPDHFYFYGFFIGRLGAEISAAIVW
jgi:hypothetical protein